MATLYEHNMLGSKISMINANFNIPFLFGNGCICLYELGITLLDENGDEKYIIELDEFKIDYERFINIRNLKYTRKAIIFNDYLGKNLRDIKNVLKRVKGNFYGRLSIKIPEVGNVILFDNQSFKYKRFYEKVNSLRLGINPLSISQDNSKKSILEFIKSKFFL